MKLIEIILFAAICFASEKCLAATNGEFVLGPPRIFKEVTNESPIQKEIDRQILTLRTLIKERSQLEKLLDDLGKTNGYISSWKRPNPNPYLKTGEPNTILILTNEPAWKMPIRKYRVYDDAANYEFVSITQTNEQPTVLILKQESSGTGIPSRPWKITLIDETNTVTISVSAGGPLHVDWNHYKQPITFYPDGSTNSGQNPK